MGLPWSKQDKQKVSRFINNNIDVSEITKIIESVRRRVGREATTSQTQNICFSGTEIEGSKINVVEKADLYIKTDIIMKNVSKTDLTRKVRAEVEDQLKSAIKSVTEGTTIFRRPHAREVRQEVLNNIDTIVKNTITEDNIQDIFIRGNISQDQQIMVDVDYIVDTDINFTLNAHETIISKVAMQNIFKRMIEQNSNVRVLAELMSKLITIRKGIFATLWDHVWSIVIVVIGFIIGLIVAMAVNGPIGVVIIIVGIIAGAGWWIYRSNGVDNLFTTPRLYSEHVDKCRASMGKAAIDTVTVHNPNAVYGLDEYGFRLQ